MEMEHVNLLDVFVVVWPGLFFCLDAYLFHNNIDITLHRRFYILLIIHHIETFLIDIVYF